MKAVIMAGGKGTRIASITNDEINLLLSSLKVPVLKHYYILVSCI